LAETVCLSPLRSRRRTPLLRQDFENSLVDLVNCSLPPGLEAYLVRRTLFFFWTQVLIHGSSAPPPLTSFSRQEFLLGPLLSTFLRPHFSDRRDQPCFPRNPSRPNFRSPDLPTKYISFLVAALSRERQRSEVES